jgi:hypothetical protein
VDKQPFENIAVSTQMSPAHPARLVEVSIGSLQQLAPSPHQLLSTLTLNPSPIGIDCITFGVLIDPALPTAIRFTGAYNHFNSLSLPYSTYRTGGKPRTTLALFILDRLWRANLSSGSFSRQHCAPCSAVTHRWAIVATGGVVLGGSECVYRRGAIIVSR